MIVIFPLGRLSRVILVHIPCMSHMGIPLPSPLAFASFAIWQTCKFPKDRSCIALLFISISAMSYYYILSHTQIILIECMVGTLECDFIIICNMYFLLCTTYKCTANVVCEWWPLWQGQLSLTMTTSVTSLIFLQTAEFSGE